MTMRLWTHNIVTNADGETTLITPRRPSDAAPPIDLSMRITAFSAARSKQMARAGRGRSDSGADGPRG